ncbi:MAG: nucleoside-diphosphate kinase [Clostridiales bacterium]|nr:nucleoside-diphosphate kinase [Clostridiales bacterium]
MEKTLVIIKPEAVTAKLVGKIISIYEDNHLNVIHAHKVLATREVLKTHYDELKEKPFFNEVLDYMSSSEVVVMILEGENVVSIVREIHGATNPANAKPGTIRYMFGTAIQENAVHGSESVEAAEREIGIWKSIINFEG